MSPNRDKSNSVFDEMNQKMTLNKLKALLAHQCSLPPEEDIIVRYIHTGVLVHFRRRLRMLSIASEKNPRTMAFLKSSAAIKQEKKRHMQHYYHIIHPFSIGRAYWEFLMMGVLIIGLIIFPIENARTIGLWYLMVPKSIIELLFLSDCIMTFFTGYYENDTKRIILNRKKIFWNYVTGLFIFDFIGSLNPTLIIKFFGWCGIQDPRLRYIKLIQFFKVLRIPTMIVYIDRYREWREGSIHKAKIFKLVLIPIILMLWLSLALWFAALYAREDWLISVRDVNNNRYITCLLRIVLLFFGVSHGIGASNANGTYILEMATLAGGFVFYMFIMSETLQIVSKYNQSVNKYFQMIQGLREYTQYMRLPDYMKTRILEYFDFRFQKTYYKEDEIMLTLSDNLRKAIILHSCKNLLDSVPLFKDLPSSLLTKLVTSMKSEIYLPSDVIVSAGSEGDSMFFIVTGTVAVYTQSGKEVAHLTDGSHFGEIALVADNDNLRVASVIAVDPCELYNLSRRDFSKAIEPYPDLYYRIKKQAQQRLEATLLKEVEKSKHSLDNASKQFHV